jgi:hypothetical protein
MNLAPVKTPGGNPVIEVPVVPISPVTTVGPALVIVEPDKTPKVEAVPKSMNVYFLTLEFTWKSALDEERTDLRSAKTKMKRGGQEKKTFHD